MYYSNSAITGASYSSLQSSVYSGFEREVFSPKYHGTSKVQDFYQTNKIQEDKPEKPKHDNKDVIFVDDMAFDFFLRFSPLLRSLESKKVRDMYSEFLKDEGKNLLKFLKEQERTFIPLEGFARMKLGENAIAAVVRTGNRAILAINLDFDEKIFNFSRHNNISIKEALTYVFAHETVHLADVHSEPITETIVGDFFKESNKVLSGVAYRRAKEVN